MSATPHGGRRMAAKRLGIPLRIYEAHIAEGKKWCTGCRAWHPKSAFGVDVSRYDGLHHYCRESIRQRTRLT